ncbi:MAG: cell wall hydrolase [Ruminococcus sp.]|nr:cell wall hydrolase [Ruminococcus sp.]
MTESTIPTSTTASETEEATDVTEVVVETTVVEETTEVADDEPVEEDLYIQHYTEQDAIDIAKVLYHECRGVPSKTEQACVAWTILNRVDCYDSTVYSVVRSPNQFAFYESAPVWDELLDLAHDVLDRWSREKNGETNVGRVLPKEYIYFEGRNGHNYFRDNYSGSYNIWDYSLESPYES